MAEEEDAFVADTQIGCVAGDLARLGKSSAAMNHGEGCWQLPLQRFVHTEPSSSEDAAVGCAAIALRAEHRRVADGGRALHALVRRGGSNGEGKNGLRKGQQPSCYEREVGSLHEASKMGQTPHWRKRVAAEGGGGAVAS